MNAYAPGTNRSAVIFPTKAERISHDWPLLSDEDLVRGCARGENAALEELVRRYQPMLSRFLARLLQSPEDTEEAVLSVFLRVWQHASRFQHRALVRTWLYRIAANIAHDLQRQKRSRPVQTPDWREDCASDSIDIEQEAIGHLERQERAEALIRALEALNPNDRLLLVLYYYEQRDYDEIQAIMSLSYTILKTRLTRARRRLRDHLEITTAEASLP